MTTSLTSNLPQEQMPNRPTAPSTFHQRSREVAKRFLQTVVVIDDQARFAPTTVRQAAKRVIEETRALEEATDEDGYNSGVDEVYSNDPETIEVPDLPQEQEKREIEVTAQHELNAQVLIRRFAGEGLVCAVLEPNEHTLTDVLDETARAAQRSDVVIVDWQIFETPQNTGGHALQLIQNILQHDKESNGRLRLFIVYTGETDIDDIAKKIKEGINEDLILDRAKPILSGNSLRIVVLAKESSKAIPIHKVSIEELPGRILDEFAEMTRGLVTNTTLVSLSVVRERTHSLLRKLHSGLDAPFLTHRALLPSPDDASEHLVDIIAGELHSALDQEDVLNQVNIESIKLWLQEHHASENYHALNKLQVPTAISSDKVISLLVNGKGKTFLGGGINNHKEDKIHLGLTYMFSTLQDEPKRKEDAERRNLEFASLTTLKTQNASETNLPLLSLGVVLCHEKELTTNNGEETVTSVNTTYWLCMQPACDSLRLTTDTKFPLLPLDTVEAANSGFELVVPIKNGINDAIDYVRLKPTRKLSKFENVLFSPSEKERLVRAVKEESGIYFYSTDGEKYRWLAQLKPNKSQDAINHLSAHLSRVPLNVFEWLRIIAEGK